jgi:hypothetical protein
MLGGGFETRPFFFGERFVVVYTIGWNGFRTVA